MLLNLLLSVPASRAGAVCVDLVPPPHSGRLSSEEFKAHFTPVSCARVKEGLRSMFRQIVIYVTCLLFIQQGISMETERKPLELSHLRLFNVDQKNE